MSARSLIEEKDTSFSYFDILTRRCQAVSQAQKRLPKKEESHLLYMWIGKRNGTMFANLGRLNDAG
jgi:hypothetical protein